MMSFKKNLFTVIFAIALVLMGSWLIGIDKAVLIDGMTLVIATMVMTLLIEDFWRKALNAKELLTWEYFAGFLIISGSVMAWLWASESATTREMALRLVATFLSAGLGGIWMAWPYKLSLQSEDERADNIGGKVQAKQQKRWDRWRKKIETASQEDAISYLSAILCYHLVGDTYLGDLDFARPLIEIDNKVLTIEEADKEGVDLNLVAQAREYVISIVNGREGK
jgi:uncharacterized membrane protein